MEIFRKRIKTIRDYIVYMHRSPSGKCYIGITKRYKRRCYEHKLAKSKTRFASAIKKYSWILFEHNILEENLTLKEAQIKEQYYIEYYNALFPNGYNLTTGGEVCICSEKTKKKISELKKGNTYCLGKKQTPEHKQKISEANKGKKRTEEQKQNNKKVWGKRVELYGLRGVPN
jgi:group I intron endonuclease